MEDPSAMAFLHRTPVCQAGQFLNITERNRRLRVKQPQVTPVIFMTQETIEFRKLRLAKGQQKQTGTLLMYLKLASVSFVEMNVLPAEKRNKQADPGSL